MAKKKEGFVTVKLQLPAGKAIPAPPVGPALGQTGINIGDFCKQFNDKTKNEDAGLIIPVIVTIAKNKSFTFELKKPPVSVLIKKEVGLAKGSGVPNKTKVGKLSKESLKKLAEVKMVDMNAFSLEAAMSMIAGTAKSMGVDVEN